MMMWAEPLLSYGLISGLTFQAILVSSHVFEKSHHVPPHADHLRDLSSYNPSESDKWRTESAGSLAKRGQFNIQSTSQKDTQTLQQGFADLVDLVTYVQQNPNPQVLARYFDPNDSPYVSSIFDTVQQMTQPGGHPRNMGNLGPTDLSSIALLRSRGIGASLGESLNWRPSAPNPTIKVYDFAWGALYKLAKSKINCDCDVKKVSDRLFHLGALLPHETLYVVLHLHGSCPPLEDFTNIRILGIRHFNTVTNIAWLG